jgi:hypothetical protein
MHSLEPERTGPADTMTFPKLIPSARRKRGSNASATALAHWQPKASARSALTGPLCAIGSSRAPAAVRVRPCARLEPHRFHYTRRLTTIPHPVFTATVLDTRRASRRAIDSESEPRGSLYILSSYRPTHNVFKDLDLSLIYYTVFSSVIVCVMLSL